MEQKEGTKIPKCKSLEKGWTKWWEKFTVAELLKKEKGVCVRTGKRVLYRKKWYWEYRLDFDFGHLNKDLSDEERRWIEEWIIDWLDKLKVGYMRTGGGIGVLVLSRIPMEIKGLQVKFLDKIVQIADWQGKGRQFVGFNGVDRLWYSNKHLFLIVKNERDFWRKLKGTPFENRKWVGSLPRNDLNKRELPIQSQTKSSEKYLPVYKTQAKEMLVDFQRLWHKDSSQYEPAKVICASGRSFIANTYYENQKKLEERIGETLDLEINQGQYYNFFNRVVPSGLFV